MRGEYEITELFDDDPIGSPPHAWGIPPDLPWNTTSQGITPTCVGNTLFEYSTTNFLQDHPHMRGEYLGLIGLALAGGGSPPHAWGIPKHRCRC